MNNFERIIAAEKAREYGIDDQDQFIYDTLTAVQSNESKTLKRILIGALVVLASVVVMIQLLFLHAASFNGLIDTIQQFLLHKPHYFAIFNLAFVAAILLFKRLRFF